ncbi:biotin transporter BioY [Enterococcus saccharolyticus]|uniref:biotin transporter BioY n=1 Tax=Enterococcus saccharolyticus TaxID=41997 RepID=UPI001E33A053|nr:biotin transporter BioY [Enterococcus saccharolyticus]MCD5002183.1 biotin transporter BioY [Enterococcus saccharolyticus]
MKLSLREQLTAAIFAGVIAVFSQIIIPLGPVPLSLQTFIVGLTVTLLGRKTGTWAIIIYLLLGLIGLPVYAGAGSGIGAVLGPTGGYLVGFLFTGLLLGTLLKKVPLTFFWVILANLISFIVTLLFGSIWLKIANDLTWTAAMLGGFLHFLLPEIIKAIAAGTIGVLLLRRLPEKFLNPK